MSHTSIHIVINNLYYCFAWICRVIANLVLRTFAVSDLLLLVTYYVPILLLVTFSYCYDILSFSLLKKITLYCTHKRKVTKLITKYTKRNIQKTA